MKLNYDEAQYFKFEHRLAGEHGQGVDKSLDAVVNELGVTYLVKSHGVKMVQTKSLRDAIKAFNETK